MKIKIIRSFCLISIFNISMCCMSQEYKAPELWDCYGKIKEIKYDSKDPVLLKKKLKFDKNGKLNNSMMFYNSNGYPEGIDLNMGIVSFIANFKFFNGNIVKAYVQRDKPNPFNFEAEYIFSDNRMESEKVIFDKGETSKELSYRFSDYKYDDKGNWTSRFVSLKSKDINLNTEEYVTYEETRKIKYY